MTSIASTAVNLPAITSFDENFEQLSMNRRIELAKFEPEPIFRNTINEIKANHLKSITYIDMSVSAITLDKPSYPSEHIKSYLMPWVLLKSPVK